MRTERECNSRRVSTPPNAFHPTFLEQVQGDDEEPLTATEADLAGPWKLETVPGLPGVVAVLRQWESQDKGDLPEAIFLHKETAALFAVLLPLHAREPRFQLDDESAPAAVLPEAIRSAPSSEIRASRSSAGSAVTTPS